MGYSVDGSPTDAVSLAFLGFFEERFDLVASGINYGANLGDDITYSGTVSAAMEAVINSCPAFAISQEYTEQIDFALAAVSAALVARNILEHGLKRGELISVNVPAVSIDECEGVEITRVGRRVYQDQLVARVDPRGIPYYWLGGPPPSGIRVPGTDFNAVVNRRVSVTPIHLDLTGRRLMRQLQDWDWSLEPVVEAGLPRGRIRRSDGRGATRPRKRGSPRSPCSSGASAAASRASTAVHARLTIARRVPRVVPSRCSRHGPHPPPPSRHLDARPGAVRARAAQARLRRHRATRRWRASSRCSRPSRSSGCRRSAPTASRTSSRPGSGGTARRVVVFSKPNAVKVRNLRANPRLMVALGRPDEDFSVGLIEAEATLEPGRADVPDAFFAKYADQLRRRRPRSRDVPRDVHAGHPDRPDPLPRLARARRAARAPGATPAAVRAGRRRAPGARPARSRDAAPRLGLTPRWPTVDPGWQSGRSGSHGGSGDGRDRQDAGWRQAAPAAAATSPAPSAASWAVKAGSRASSTS